MHLLEGLKHIELCVYQPLSDSVLQQPVRDCFYLQQFLAMHPEDRRLTLPLFQQIHLGLGDKIRKRNSGVA